MQVDLKNLKPLGIVLILLTAVLMLVVCFTADLGVPERYEPEHNTAYYSQSPETMEELCREIEEHVLPEIEEAKDCRYDGDIDKIVVTAENGEADKVRLLLKRSFDESLFEVREQT
jgi:hypothetical protein